MRRTLDLVENLVGNLSGLALVCDEGLVNVNQSIFVHNKWRSPSLIRTRHRICCLNSNQESALKIENGIDVEEDLVQGIAGDCALLFERLFQVVQILKILDVFSLGIDKFPDNMISVGHLSPGRFVASLIVGIVLSLKEIAAFLCSVQDVVNNLSYLNN